MENIKTPFLILIICFFFLTNSKAQNDSITFDLISKHQYPGFYSSYAAIFDKQNRPYIYTANLEYGVIIFDISVIEEPEIIKHFMPADFNGLQPMNLDQDGDHLYIALGNIFGGQTSGVAVLDISDPASVTILSQWDSAYFDKGAPVVKAVDAFVYVGLKNHGLAVLDASNKNNIKFLSHLIPDPDYPKPPIAQGQAQTRGMDFRNDTLFICVDRQGSRMIDVSDKNNPVEIGKYYNSALYDSIRPANNEILVLENYAFISLDHCGMEVIDFSSTVIEPVFLYNPWNCTTNPWNGAPMHTNQMAFSGDSLLFVSGADSEVLVFDIKDRENPILAGSFGHAENLSVSWGLDVRGDYIVLANVHVIPVFPPYTSDWGGIQILKWNTEKMSSVNKIQPVIDKLSVYPNPFKDKFTIKINTEIPDHAKMQIFDLSGKVVYSDILSLQKGENEHIIETNLPPGIYFLNLLTLSGSHFSINVLKKIF